MHVLAVRRAGRQLALVVGMRRVEIALVGAPLTGDQVQAADVVVTMGSGDACPFCPGKRYLDWDLPNPAGLDRAAVRSIRDDIHQWVGHLLSELTAQ
jgi:protein-tyrosine-phosphatase